MSKFSNFNIIVLDWGCLQLRVCLTQMSSFSMFNIIVLDWGAYPCVCVSNTIRHRLLKKNIIVLDGGGGGSVACVSNTNVLV